MKYALVCFYGVRLGSKDTGFCSRRYSLLETLGRDAGLSRVGSNCKFLRPEQSFFDSPYPIGSDMFPKRKHRPASSRVRCCPPFCSDMSNAVSYDMLHPFSRCSFSRQVVPPSPGRPTDAEERARDR